MADNLFPAEHSHVESPTDSEASSRSNKAGFLDFLTELPILIIVAFAIALLIKTFVVQAFFIPSGSMEPTLDIGDRVLVSKFSYRISSVKPGDVVVFIAPTEQDAPRDEGTFKNIAFWIAEGLGLKSNKRDFIKRVVAVEGQWIEIRDGTTYVDGRPVGEPFVARDGPSPDFPPLHVPPDTIFVMGDNRNQSLDSRRFGPVDKSMIVGKAFVLIWPLDHVGGL